MEWWLSKYNYESVELKCNMFIVSSDNHQSESSWRNTDNIKIE